MPTGIVQQYTSENYSRSDAVRIRDALRCGQSGCRCRAGSTVHCPAHNGTHANLAVNEKDGKVLLHCFGDANCSQDAVIEALRGLDLWPSRAPSTGNGVTRYEVRDTAGALHATHVRKDLPNGNKQIWWEPKGKRTADLPLYGAENLNGQHTAVVVEGESAADSLSKQLEDDHIAVVATVTGASGTPSDDSLGPLLDYDVILWPDADPEGMAHQGRIGARLLQLGHPNVRIVSGLDAADFALSAREIIERKVKPFKPDRFLIPGPLKKQELGTAPSRLINVWEEEEPPIRLWDIPALLPRDTLTLWYGDSGVYKSILATALAMAKVAGDTFLGHRLAPGPVLYVDTEFSQSEFVRRCYQLARGMGMDRPPEGLHYFRTDASLSKSIQIIAGMVDHLGGSPADLVLARQI